MPIESHGLLRALLSVVGVTLLNITELGLYLAHLLYLAGLLEREGHND